MGVACLMFILQIKTKWLSKSVINCAKIDDRASPQKKQANVSLSITTLS